QRACSTAFMAAAARAAAEAGRFSGTTRECLLEYAALQETAAGLIRASDARGDSLRLTTPACYNRGEARWGYEALAAACPHGAWTAGNSGRVDCAAAAHLATTDSLRRDSAALPPNAADVAARGFAAGLGLLQEGLPLEAEAEFRQALTLTPADPSLHAGLGTALARQQRWTEAEAAYRAAVWLDPSNTQFADMLRGLRARGAPTAQTAVHAYTGPARALSVAEKPTVARRVNVPAILAAAFKIIFATALSAAGLLLFFPVLSALYLALLWGGGRLLRLGT
ncbi:MAG TPA: tetratricopeptide repeat protein, partial [Longimicrobium sp.]|nr:tetratricopeptide repeat protein [Longimicrobium sp.]